MRWLESRLLMPVLSVTSAMRLPPWVPVKRMNFVACCRKLAVIHRHFRISPQYCCLISHELIRDWWTERCRKVFLIRLNFPLACLLRALVGWISMEKLCSWVWSQKSVCFSFAVLVCCLIMAVRIHVSEDLSRMGAGGICPLVPVECTDTAWCDLTFYYLKCCIMRQLDLFKTLQWCNNNYKSSHCLKSL